MQRIIKFSFTILEFVQFFIIAVPLFIVVTILIEITFFIQSLKSKKNEQRSKI